ncbi:MAG TPA: acetyl-CoA carboxylase biotin carboxyl carrier protein [Epulopiscium sp.]|nr:acetyl-CoA carboxylase biotin carboxyl carrier protein [Candidatus Epulonipiscium sp.]
MDIKVIKEIMREFKECELTKLEIKHDDIEIKIEKKKEIIVAPTGSQSPAPLEETVSVAPSCSTIVAETASIKNTPEITGCAIMSPMVGTVYTAPNPESDNFVSVGQKVKKGDVVCIIEAMKLMNEVEAEIDGEVIEILAQNEGMVEFGQPLFIINPQA